MSHDFALVQCIVAMFLNMNAATLPIWRLIVNSVRSSSINSCSILFKEKAKQE